MNKDNLVIILNDCFKEDTGKCAVLHFIDGSELLIDKLPSFFNVHMAINIEKDYGEKKINEVYHIPFQSVIYVTETNFENLQVIATEYMNEYMKQYSFIGDDEEED